MVCVYICQYLHRHTIDYVCDHPRRSSVRRIVHHMYIHINHDDDVSMSWVKECAALDGDERFGCRKESDSECYVVVHLDDMYIHKIVWLMSISAKIHRMCVPEQAQWIYTL